MLNSDGPRSTRMPTRRAIVASGAAVIAAPAISRAASRRLAVADPGGPFQKAFTEAFYTPFAAASGVEVVSIATANENAGAIIRSVVETGSYPWDTMLVTRGAAQQVIARGLIEEIGSSSRDIEEIPADLRNEHWLGINVSGLCISYRTDTYRNGGPGSYKDVWDVARFPGRRGLRKTARESVEMAMRADGVPGGAEVYRILAAPGGWDRAFAALDRIKPHVNVWWQAAAQSTQLLATGEVDILPAFNGRVQAAIDGGTPARIEWNEGVTLTEGFVIPKGSLNAGLARDFIAFCANAERQAAFTRYIAYGPTNLNAYKFIDPKRGILLPTHPDNYKKTTPSDDEFWAKNLEYAEKRMAEWLLK